MTFLSPIVDRVWRLRPHVYRALDRFPSRALLARAASFVARHEASEDVELLWSGCLWMFRVGGEYLPGERHLVYRHGDDVARWPVYERALTEDHWFHVYEPKEET
jgi:hypothetical protein